MLSENLPALVTSTLLSIALAFSPSAYGTTPQLSGTYLFVQETVCPAILGKTSAAGTSIIDHGDERIQTATLTFNPTTHVVTGTGFGAETGGLAQGAGTTLASGQKAYTLNQSYSVSGDTLSFVAGGSNKVTLHVTYGTLKSGIAQSADLLGLESAAAVTGGSAMCTLHITVTHL